MSRTPLVEPGRLTMSVRPRTPAMPRLSAARGKLSPVTARNRSAMPGASRSSAARVASGVTSRGLSPVPPVVSTRSATSPSHQATSWRAMGTTPSLTTVRAARSPRIVETHAAAASPEPSARSPRDVASEMVSTATRMCGTRVASEMGRVLVEGRLDDRGGETLAADLDLEGRPFLRASEREIRRADGDSECGAHRATPHLAARRAVVVHRVAVPREAALAHRETDEAARETALLLRDERIAADEVALVQLHEPGESRLEGRRGVVDVVAVERHPHLEAQGVARAEAA